MRKLIEQEEYPLIHNSHHNPYTPLSHYFSSNRLAFLATADAASGLAKNFYENGYNIFYPQIDWRGNTAGYVESEFHIYPFIVSLFYGMFGVDDMWGRIVSLIFSVLTVYGLFLLVRKITSERTALWSAFIYAVLPLNIYFTRAFMPESMMLMCSVYGLYFYNEWLENDKWKNFICRCSSLLLQY